MLLPSAASTAEGATSRVHSVATLPASVTADEDSDVAAEHAGHAGQANVAVPIKV